MKSKRNNMVDFPSYKKYTFVHQKLFVVRMSLNKTTNAGGAIGRDDN